MNINEFFKRYNKVAIAFSGGVDSAYLLYCAKQCNADARAYYVKSQFQPQFEYDDAIRLAKEIGIPLKVIELDVLSVDRIRRNDELRCYYCKNEIFSRIKSTALADGYDIILDGTNASDNADDRPGMKALTELGVLSPLRLCGLEKSRIRELCKKAGLFVWNKPAYACLATRIKPHEAITADALGKVERAEMFMTGLGFSNHRVRASKGTANIITTPLQTELLNEYRQIIYNELIEYFNEVNFQK